MNEDKKSLGCLEPVELREVWKSESADFTPWLGKAENLKLLGDTIGIELEFEAQEKDVGPFRADILCKVAESGDWVVIENQLECTNHDHLGKLLTYAAGLDAKAVVWLAKKFTDEHRAALEWLDKVSRGSLNFFGLEVELWRIGNSAVAPKFNVVCYPNEWSEEASAVGQPNELQLLQQDYWVALRAVLKDRNSPVRLRKPRPQHWAAFAMGRADFGLHASMDTQKGSVRVQIACRGANAHAHFALLKEDEEAIEKEMGCALDWRPKPDLKTAAIALVKHDVVPTNRDDWPSQHLWFAEKLEALYKTFVPRVKNLDLDGEPLTNGGQLEIAGP